MPRPCAVGTKPLSQFTERDIILLRNVALDQRGAGPGPGPRALRLIHVTEAHAFPKVDPLVPWSRVSTTATL